MVEEVLINFHFPFLIIAIIIGYQISNHFFYLYISKKKDNLRLNRILLAYGFLYFFLITATLLRTIYTYFIEDLTLGAQFVQLSLLHVAIGAILFLYCLTEEGFNSLINTKITKFILILTIIITTLLYFIGDSLFQIIISLIAISIAGVYVLTFHYRLLSLSSGVIKNRLILITMGNILMIFAMMAQTDEYIYFLPQDLQISSMIVSVPLFVLGEMTIFLGVFKFPAFLEFDWKEHILSLYIIENVNLSILYQHEFVDKIEIKQYQELADILTKGVVGIDKVLSSLSTTDRNIERIVQEDLILLFGFGNLKVVSIVYLLIVDKDLESYPYFLSQIQKDFEFYFKDILFDLKAIEGHEDLVFSGFDLAIKKMLKL